MKKPINVLSLFDGLSCGRIALDKAGISVGNYYASEIEKGPMAMAVANYPKTIQLGDVTKWKEWNLDWSSIDLLTAGFPCFAAGTLINTKRGLIKIEDVQMGDMVLTHKARYKKVLIPMEKTADHHNLLKLQGAPEIKVTDEHPFYIKEAYLGENRKKMLGRAMWKECKDLKKGDHIGIAINQESIIPKISGIDTSNPHFWYFIGVYMAKGHSSSPNKVGKNKIRYYTTHLSSSKKDLKVMQNIAKKAGYYAGIVDVETTRRVTIADKKLWHFIQQFGRGSKNKRIPQFVFDLPTDLLKEYLEGYLFGDGFRIKDKKISPRYTIKTISKDLAYGTKEIIQKVYKTLPTLNFYKVEPKAIIKGRLVNKSDTYTIKFYKKCHHGSKYKVDPNGKYIWAPFKGRKRINRKTKVYNFEVEGDNSYTADGHIAHNCQAWSPAGKKEGTDDPRGALAHTLFDIFEHLKKVNPNIKFLFENVKMKKEHLDYLNELFGIEPVLINSLNFVPQSRERYYWTNLTVEDYERKQHKLSEVLEKNVDEKYFLKEERSDYLIALASMSNKDRKNVYKNKLDINTYFYLPEKTISKGDFIYNQHLGQNGRISNPYCLTLTCSGKMCCVDELNGKLRVRYLTPTEYEALQGVPKNYTNHSSSHQRYRALGNGWTVDVISHIYKGLKDEKS